MRTEYTIAVLGVAVLLSAAAPVHGQARGEAGESAAPLGRLAYGEADVQGNWVAVRGGSVSLTNPVSQAQDFEKQNVRLPSRIVDPPDGWFRTRRGRRRDGISRPRLRLADQAGAHRHPAPVPALGVPRLYYIVPPYKNRADSRQVVFIWQDYHATGDSARRPSACPVEREALDGRRARPLEGNTWSSAPQRQGADSPIPDSTATTRTSSNASRSPTPTDDLRSTVTFRPSSRGPGRCVSSTAAADEEVWNRRVTRGSSIPIGLTHTAPPQP